MQCWCVNGPHTHSVIRRLCTCYLNPNCSDLCSVCTFLTFNQICLISLGVSGPNNRVLNGPLRQAQAHIHDNLIKAHQRFTLGRPELEAENMKVVKSQPAVAREGIFVPPNRCLSESDQSEAGKLNKGTQSHFDLGTLMADQLK